MARSISTADARTPLCWFHRVRCEKVFLNCSTETGSDLQELLSWVAYTSGGARSGSFPKNGQTGEAVKQSVKRLEAALLAASRCPELWGCCGAPTAQLLLVETREINQQNTTPSPE